MVAAAVAAAVAVAVGSSVFLKSSLCKRYLIVLELRLLPPKVFQGNHRVEDRVLESQV